MRCAVFFLLLLLPACSSDEVHGPDTFLEASLKEFEDRKRQDLIHTKGDVIVDEDFEQKHMA